MKDYIYLDSELLNSSLAQYEEGLIYNISQGKAAERNNYSENAKNVSGGIDGILGIGAKIVRDTIETNGQELTKGQSETIDYVLSDYAVDLLLKKVKDFSIFKDNVIDAFEGDYINQHSHFKIYDFDLMAKISASENLNFLVNELSEEEKKRNKELRKQLQLIRAQKKGSLTSEDKQKISDYENQIDSLGDRSQSLQEFELIHKGVSFATKIFDDSILIKSENALSICKRNWFRLNQAQLSFLTESSRNLTIFGVITAIKEKTHSGGEFSKLNSDELNRMPNMFHDIFLSNFDMLHDNDRIIKPIAIFFE